MTSILAKRRVVAAFDFDGTLIKGDSLFYFFLSQVSKWKLLLNLIPALYYIGLYKLKLMPNFKAKEHLFILFFKGMPLAGFERQCKKFKGLLEKKLKPEATAKLRWHLQSGHDVVIISASVENWVSPLAVQLGVRDIMGTKLETENGRLTGRFLSKNCYGPEKISRLEGLYPQRTEYVLYAYGDSRGDRELLAAADHPFYRSF